MFLQSIISSPIFAFVLHHGQEILIGLLLVFMALVWFRGASYSRRRVLAMIAFAVLAVRVFFAALLSYTQYYVWMHDGLGQLFLPPNRSWGYFFQYVLSRYWTSAGIAIVVAIGAYLFLWGLHRYRERFFEGGEAELGFAICLMVGWPGVVVFIAGTCLGIIIVSIVRQIWLAQTYTTLGIPMLIGGALALILNHWLIPVLGLNVLKA